MRTLALIPARAGSRGIPGKNRRNFNGFPLWLHAADAGRLAGCQWIVVSTDDQDIYDWAMQCGDVGLKRPASLAADETPMLAVVQHAVSSLSNHGFDAVVLLQPTQPIRKPEHVTAALRLLEEAGADSVVSVVEIPAHYSPDYATKIEGNRLMPFEAPVCYMTTGDYSDEAWSDVGSALRAQRLDAMPTRRQGSRPAYSRDGTVYAIRRKTIENGSLYGEKCVPLIIPSHESVNLDTEEDWQRAEAMVKR